jgi:hypothetical protein
MEEGFIFGCFFIIWDADDNENVKIGFGTYRDPLVVLIYGPCGVENFIVVLIEDVNDECE